MYLKPTDTLFAHPTERHRQNIVAIRFPLNSARSTEEVGSSSEG